MIRKQIRRWLIGELEHLSILGLTVTDDDAAPDRKSDLPVANVMWGVERESEDVTLETLDPSDKVIYDAELEIALVYSMGNLTELSNAIDDAIAGIRDMVRGDRTLGGHALDAYYQSSVPAPANREGKFPVKMVTVIIAVRYLE